MRGVGLTCWIVFVCWIVYVCWTAVMQHRAIHRLGNVEGVMLHGVSLSEGHTHTYTYTYTYIYTYTYTLYRSERESQWERAGERES